jgi:glycerol-3-phosphate cytidylyltransferase
VNLLTIGTFDLLHVGHLELLQACRFMVDGEVWVALNTDAFVTSYKGRAPVQPYDDRAEMLRACRFVDRVFCNAGNENSGLAIDVLRPDILAIGSDWQDRDYLGQLGVTQAWLTERGLSVTYVPRTRGVSTTDLRERIVA